MKRKPTVPPHDDDFFDRHYGLVRYPLDTVDVPGLRRGQLGAIHALAGYLTIHKAPGVVVMPTGSGKTTVLMAMPFLCRARRVLVVTPSQLVRSQIAEEFAELGVLRRLGVVPADIPNPCVHELEHKMASAEKWEKLRPFNVVVTTPNTISPVLGGVVPPPDDFFDLLLIDEAHHSAAKSWAAVLAAFPHARKALFTATPFRRDKREIKGTIVFTYALSEARKDRVFGDISYVPVSPIPPQTGDIAIAKQVAQALKDDRAAGFKHSVLVRVDQKVRGEALAEVYAEHTDLKLQLIHSSMSNDHIRSAIAAMREGSLDGVICVNMLGEGFDFPNLKIAALHSPHRSLGVTLQFIGRFARVGGESLGPARFFAVPDEIEGETKTLFEEDASWQDLVVGLSEGRIEVERKIREDIATFEEPLISEPNLADLSLYALTPGFHAKIYQVPQDIDLFNQLALPRPFEVVYWQESPELSAVVLIASEQDKPRWTSLPRFGQIKHELFVLYFNREASLLFICASRRSDSLYRHIGAHYAGESAKILPLFKINRILNGLTNVDCHNLGMRNRLHTSRNERYRIIAGSSAAHALRETDGRMFHRGHVSCSGMRGSTRVNIGYSSASKVWSMSGGSIPVLIHWCGDLAKSIASDAPQTRVAGLDILSVGEPLKSIPANVLAVDWDEEVYLSQIEMSYVDANGDTVPRRPLLDVDVRVDRAACTDEKLAVVVTCGDQEWRLSFRPNGNPMFTFDGTASSHPTLHYNDDELKLAGFLNEYPLHFYFADFARLRGEEWFPCNPSSTIFSPEHVETIDWTAAGVNVQQEFWTAGQTKIGLSIHDYLEQHLNADEHAIVLYDHRSGEVADFLTLEVGTSKTVVRLYHCKGSGGADPGNRVSDVYDVCGQVTKSFNKISRPKDLIAHVKRRTKSGSRFIKGTFETFQLLMAEGQARGLEFQLVIVQPGISRGNLMADNASVLASVNEYVLQLGCKELLVLGSA